MSAIKAEYRMCLSLEDVVCELRPEDEEGLMERKWDRTFSAEAVQCVQRSCGQKDLSMLHWFSG